MKSILKNTFAKKGRLPTFCGPQNWQTSSFPYTFETNYCIFGTKGTFASFGLSFSPKLANVPPGKNVGTRTPPNLGGSFNHRIPVKQYSGINRLRAFRLANVLRLSFVGLWVAGLWAWACVYVCVCVCVCVYVFFGRVGPKGVTK